ncbi:MAG TPA: response regulator [Candidatus Binatia bacterium]|jgi:CheY-like chemotaxis protein|nr:response regulator [Candidatus Binatia bacterium]
MPTRQVTPSASLPPVPVLVVDDNDGFLHIVHAALRETSPRFAVHSVSSGTEALAFLERRAPFAAAPRPAFVLLDLRLPDFDAPEVLRRIAADGRLASMPVLVVSTARWDDEVVALEQAGATHIQLKPSRVQALRDMLVTFWKEQVDGQDPPDRG